VHVPRAGLDTEPPANVGVDYFAVGRKITQTTTGLSRRHRSPLAAILPFTVMVRSVLDCGVGARHPLPCGVADRDRDESSRRGISAWVRTNPQTHAGCASAVRAPIFLR